MRWLYDWCDQGCHHKDLFSLRFWTVRYLLLCSIWWLKFLLICFTRRFACLKDLAWVVWRKQINLFNLILYVNLLHSPGRLTSNTFIKHLLNLPDLEKKVFEYVKHNLAITWCQHLSVWCSLSLSPSVEMQKYPHAKHKQQTLPGSVKQMLHS